jgi:hypothetical protein
MTEDFLSSPKSKTFVSDATQGNEIGGRTRIRQCWWCGPDRGAFYDCIYIYSNDVYGTVESAVLTVYIRWWVSKFLNQFEVDFVKTSYVLYFGFVWVFERLKMCHLVWVYSNNLFGCRNVNSNSGVCRSVHKVRGRGLAHIAMPCILLFVIVAWGTRAY